MLQMLKSGDMKIHRPAIQRLERHSVPASDLFKASQAAVPGLRLPPAGLVSCPTALPLGDGEKITSFENELEALHKWQGVTSMPVTGLC